MPTFSSVRNTLYKEDDTFKPTTTYGAEQPPDYSLHFNVRNDYSAEFAFDNCSYYKEFETKLDKNLLNLRYERLFKYPKGKYPEGNEYYLVPWLGITYSRNSDNTFQLDTNTYKLRITFISPYGGHDYLDSLFGSGKTLKLRSNKPGDITPIWVDSINNSNPEEISINRLDLFEDQDIRITISNNRIFDLNKQYIEILDISNNDKLVGKLRLAFLEKITQKVLYINVTKNTDFEFQLLKSVEIPKALESDGSPTHEHEKLDDAANFNGFNPYGIQLELDEDIELFGRNDPASSVQKILSSSATQPLTIPITWSAISTDPLTFNPSLILSGTEPDFYDKLIEEFFKRIWYAENISGTFFSKYEFLYIFLTPFPLNLSNSGQSRTHTLYLAKEKNKYNVRSRLPMNASLFQTVLFKYGGTDYNSIYHKYRTLVHECAHALFVNHYFFEVDKPNDYEDQTIWTLKLYLDDNEGRRDLRISDFVIGVDNAGGQKTIFDEIIDYGLSAAAGTWLETRVFPDGMPSYWGVHNLDAIFVEELYILQALNDLSKYRQFRTLNTMDYLDGNTAWGRKYAKLQIYSPPSGSPKQVYFEKQNTVLDRFQWEVARSAVVHFGEVDI